LSYSPGPHATQASCAAVCRNPPAQKHPATPALPGSELEFPGHAAHAAAADVVPATTPYVFAPQGAHPLSAPSPPVSEYLPTGQSRHVAALVAPSAALHVPAPQEAHAAEPAAVLYCPATHAAHGPPSAPVCPAAHEQFSRDPDAAGELDPAGHAWQSGLPLSDHVPAGHHRQDSASTAPATEYSPAPHREHS
jgi:hypothetical protein